MKKIILIFSVLAISLTVLLTSGKAISPSYYVSPTGSDQNPGTITQPWKTIQKAADSTTTGDTVYIRGGTYNEKVTLFYKTNPGPGYITFTSYPGEEAILDGTGIAIQYGGGIFHIEHTNYIRVTGLTIQHSNGAGIYASYSNYIDILNNRTYDTVKSGISIWGVSHAVIDGNDIALACNSHPNYPASEENISIAASSSYVEVKNNFVHQAANIPDGYSGGEGINIKDGAHDITVHHNTVRLDERLDGKPSNRLAFGLDGWQKETYNVSFYSNIAFNNLIGYVVESEAGATARDIYVYNNVAYNNSRVGYLIPDWAQNETSLKKNIYFVNNTSYKNGAGFHINSIKIENVVIRNNIVSQSGTPIVVGTGVPQAQIISDHNFISGDPAFVNPSAGDFHLQSHSPAIDAGSSLNAPGNDFAGLSRPQGAGFDLGAFESQGTTGSTATAYPTASSTRTNTAVPPSATTTRTNTAVPPTATIFITNTPVPPTATVKPSNTSTSTPVPQTATLKPSITSTNTPLPPTATQQPASPTFTKTTGASATAPSLLLTSTRYPVTYTFQVGVSPDRKYTAAIDAYLSQTSPADNYGSGTKLRVSGLVNSEHVVLIRWDIARIPPSKRVASASLVFNLSGANGQTYQVYQALRKWDQNQATWAAALNGVNWQQPGAKGAYDRGTVVLGTLKPTTDGTYTINLNNEGLKVVQNWVRKASPNYGFVLVASTGASTLEFSSNENITPSLRPKLVIQVASN